MLERSPGGGLFRHRLDNVPDRRHELFCLAEPVAWEGFVLASKAIPGNPYDGHTLARISQRIVRITGADNRTASARRAIPAQIRSGNRLFRAN